MLFERFAFCYYKYIILKDRVLKAVFRYSFFDVLLLMAIFWGVLNAKKPVFVYFKKRSVFLIIINKHFFKKNIKTLN